MFDPLVSRALQVAHGHSDLRLPEAAAEDPGARVRMEDLLQ